METNTILAELKAELEELKGELSIIEKHLIDKKKMNNNFFKELMFEKDEVEKLIAEVEIEIEIETNSLKTNTNGDSDNIVN